MKKFFLLSFLISACIFHASSSDEASLSSVISPVGEAADFGIIREADGPKTIRFYVRNITDSEISLLKVRPTCGCTAADFQKDPVSPGDSAWIDLTYDPSRRPGRFEKGVKIYPVEGEMLRVPVIGVVSASPETIESFFPIDAGLLHLSERTVMTLSPLDDRERSLYINVYNSGESPVWLSLESDSNAVETQAFPSPVAPLEQGQIGIYIKPSKETRSGHLEYSLRLITSLSPLGSEEQSTTEPFEIKLITEK